MRMERDVRYLQAQSSALNECPVATNPSTQRAAISMALHLPCGHCLRLRGALGALGAPGPAAVGPLAQLAAQRSAQTR
jgi:hypothetical protein